VKPTEAPASLSAATMTPVSLLTPNEAPPASSSLVAAADTPATAPAPSASTAALPPPTKPNAVALLEENAPKAEKTEKSKPAAKVEAKPLVRPNPVPPPTQMLKRIAEAPPTKKAETTKKAASDAPPKTAAKATAARTHTLKSGETLFRLASKYGVSVAAIQKANNIKNPNSMRDGMKVVIPAK
jgi:LysM repeat protein